MCAKEEFSSSPTSGRPSISSRTFFADLLKTKLSSVASCWGMITARRHTAMCRCCVAVKASLASCFSRASSSFCSAFGEGESPSAVAETKENASQRTCHHPIANISQLSEERKNMVW